MQQTWLVWKAALAPEICDYFIKTGLEAPAQEASIGFSGDIHADESYRKSTIHWVNDPIVSAVLHSYGLEANKVWNFDISGGVKEVQFTEYGLNGKYDWHHDVDWRCQTHDRKLSVVVQLSSDYEGGEFQFKSPADSLPLDLFRPRGSILVFPSFFEHKVHPVTSGTRYSMVTWIQGPKYR
jgi:PKHD-type hydroxylase